MSVLFGHVQCERLMSKGTHGQGRGQGPRWPPSSVPELLRTAGAHSYVLPTHACNLTFMVWLLRQHKDWWRPLSGASFLLRSSSYKLGKTKSCV